MKAYNISKNVFKNNVKTKENSVTKASGMPDSETLVTKFNDIMNNLRLKKNWRHK